jgi:hypothetical protein
VIEFDANGKLNIYPNAGKKFSEGPLNDAVLNVYLSLNLIPQFILDNIKVDIIYCKEFIF